jgi:hypothetical protein
MDGYDVPHIPPEGPALYAYIEHRRRALPPKQSGHLDSAATARSGGHYLSRSGMKPSSSLMGPATTTSTLVAVGHGGAAATSIRCSASMATCRSTASSPSSRDDLLYPDTDEVIIAFWVVG